MQQGHPTRDPTAALAGSLLAFGGNKGFALLVALEAMTGVLAGGAFADQVSSKEAAPSAPEGTAHTMIAIDLKKAIGRANYVQRLDDMLNRLCGLPTAAEDATRSAIPASADGNCGANVSGTGFPCRKVISTGCLEAAREAGVSTA